MPPPTISRGDFARRHRFAEGGEDFGEQPGVVLVAAPAEIRKGIDEVEDGAVLVCVRLGVAQLNGQDERTAAPLPLVERRLQLLLEDFAAERSRREDRDDGVGFANRSSISRAQVTPTRVLRS